MLLWLFGYLLGFVFFPFVPTAVLGWYIMPVGLAVTCLVLWRYVQVDRLVPAVIVGSVWCLLAIGLDYVFLVKLLNPSDGYYKLDVYLYYVSALILPVAAAVVRGRFKS